MATGVRKAGKKRAGAPKRARPIRKPKSAGPKSARLKSGRPKPGKPESGKPKSETARLKSLLRAAGDRQSASAEILRTIASVSGNAERSLYQIAETTKRLFDASSVSIFVAADDEWGQIIHDGASSKRIGAEVPAAQLRVGGHSLPGATFGENRQIHLPDINNVDPAIADWPGLRPARAAGSRTISGTPLRSAGRAIGVLIVHRDRLAPFTAEELGLLQSFADQAAIAVENTRLFNETHEALERQTATADILKVIASSPSDVQPVFEAIAATANRLIGGFSTAVFSIVNDMMHLNAFTPTNPAADAAVKATFPRPLSSQAWGDQIRNGQIVHILDTEIEWAEQPSLRDMARMRGFRSMVLVPLLRDRATIGTIAVSRAAPGTFTAHHVQLLQTFADQAVIAIGNVRLFDEVQAKTADLQESLQQQTATADVLQVISNSPGELGPVFRSVLENATRICDAKFGTLLRFDGNAFYFAADVGTPAALAEYVRRPGPFEGLAGGMVDRILRTRQVQHSPDYAADAAPGLAARLGGARSTLGVPILRDDVLVGAIVIYRQEVRPFSNREIDLVRSFAAQAAIAIENARLFNETQEALERQTATADILRVISLSPTDVQPVFNALVLTAQRLLRREMAFILLCEAGTTFRPVAITGPEGLVQILNPTPIPIDPEVNFPSLAIVSKQNQQFPDWSAIDLPEEERKIREMYGLSSALYLPMLRGGECIGVLGLGGRQPGSFSETDIALAESFRDQAVIAIENARLFNETQEALERQTATSDVLNVIASSPTDTQPVFDAIARSAAELCEGTNSGVFRLRDGLVHLAGHHNLSPEQLAFVPKAFPAPLHRGYMAGRAIVDRAMAHVPDIAADPEYNAESIVKAGFRSAVSVPMFRNGEPIGAINVTREEARPFSDRQIELLRTFADQAVIAIENTRLFNETREALERETSSADILRVISSSPTDVQPVFDAIVASLLRLFGTEFAVVQLLRDGSVTMPAVGGKPGFERLAERFPRPLDDTTIGGMVMLAKQTRQFAAQDDSTAPLGTQQFARDFGFNSVLFTPMIHEGEVIGCIGTAHPTARVFDPHQVALIETFARQAVIAIQNARLFNETREALESQTATADILRVIASSPDDVQPVFQAIAERSNRLVNGLSTTVLSVDDDTIRLSAFTRTNSAADAALIASFPRRLSEQSFGDSISKGEIFRLPDTEADPSLRDLARLRGYRSMLFVPLLHDGALIGTIGQTRVEPGPFAENHVQLLKTFADQAVIAISNVGLFKEVEERTKELSQSLNDLRAAQDRLVQTEKLASLGQLTAGIAHEIKNPLNFVNNFSALSAELVDELNDTLKPAALESKMRLEVDDLTEMLKGNLEKVVQHGKRADSIVKNMLLHSREGSGEHRPIDINAIVDESLNLAYHGARAEKAGFDITVQRDFDPAAGMTSAYPQEITRVLLNLISNGFYATTKRSLEAGDGFEPTLSATTRNLGDTVEIRIRDNGTGILEEVKEKIFNPFFTTKPAGEGTGLGLSMSHDIIVKQHGGTIDVETEAGQFTEFRIVLPRASRR